MESQLPPTLHKIATVSGRTGLSRSALYREMKGGRLAVVKIGRSVRIREQDLLDFINALTVNPLPLKPFTETVRTVASEGSAGL